MIGWSNYAYIQLACSRLSVVGDKRKKKLVREFQIVQSVIYVSDVVVTQVLTPAVLSLGSQLGVFLFTEYEWAKTW